MDREDGTRKILQRIFFPSLAVRLLEGRLERTQKSTGSCRICSCQVIAAILKKISNEFLGEFQILHELELAREGGD